MLLRYTLNKSKTTTVQITDPVYNHGFFTGPATIHIAAKITTPDPGITISKVEFYHSDTLLYTDVTAPYSYAWKNVPTGEYAVTAKATDNKGTTTTSAITVISILPNKPPFAEITSPVYWNSHFQAPLDLTVSANAYDQDPDGTISKVEFYNGSTLLYTDSVSPYTFTWHNVPTGTDSIIAKAFDNSGLSTLSAPLLITVDPNTPPTVAILSPLDSQYFHGPATISINADAYDQYGVLSKVEFYNGTVLLNTDSIYPYTFTWSNVPPGSYVITARATDNSGLVSSSAAIHVFVLSNLPPAVRLLSPAEGEPFIAPAFIDLYAWAKDPDGVIKKVEFYAGDTLIGTEINKPYERMWKHVAAGNYTLTARATDDSGKVTISAPVHIIVKPDAAPVVNIISPANNSLFIKGTTIHLEATASDTDGAIRKVAFYRDTTLLTTEHKIPYTYDWTIEEAGNYTITARATDNLGTVTTSSAINISVVTNQPSAVSMVPPLNEQAGGKNYKISVQLTPNPARNILNINITAWQLHKNSTLSLLSASGIVLKTLQTAGSAKTIQLDVSTLVSGTYIIKIINGDKVIYRQFVKM